MSKPLHLTLCPQCTATSKRTRGRCGSPAVKGWTVCRHHGARGGGPKGRQNGQFRHGQYTCEAIEGRRLLSGLLKATREQLEALS